MEEDPAEHTIKQYIAAGAAEGATSAAEKLRQVIGVELDQILATVRSSIDPAVAPAGGGSVIVIAGLATAHASAQGAIVIPGDAAAAVIRPAEVDEVTRRAARGSLAALNAKQQVIVAAVLIAAVFSMLPHDVRERLLDDINLVTVIASVLELIKP
jgi:hypothetical protein